MTTPKDEQVRAVCAQLDDLLAALRANVAALNKILEPPPSRGPDQEVPAR